MISRGRVLKESVVEQLHILDHKFTYPESGEKDITTRIISVAGGRVGINKHEVMNLPHNLPELPDFCYVGGAEQAQVFEAIAKERQYQEEKFGENKPQSLAGYLLILESELEEAKRGWIKNLPGKSAPLNEIVQIAAVAVACLERYGLTGNAVSTNDIPDNEHN